MKQAHPEDQVLPYPKSRRFLEAAMRSTHHKPMIHGLLEVDVTDARASLRDYQTRTGEPLSFTRSSSSVWQRRSTRTRPYTLFAGAAHASSCLPMSTC